MTTETDETTEKAPRGWSWIIGSPKWHYFIGAHSVCDRWLGLGIRDEDKDDDPTTDNSPDNCAACMKKVAKLRAREASNDD